MKRLVLAASLLFVPAVVQAQAASHPIAQFSLPDAATLEDSVLGPGAPIAIAWDAALGGWKGVGNGVEYRVIKSDGINYEVRAIIPAGNFALASSPVWTPGQRVPDPRTVVYRDHLTAAGPIAATWGVGQVTITLGP